MSLEFNKKGWKNCTLGDIVTFKRGFDLSKDEMAEGQYPVVGSNGIIGYHNEFTTDAPGITIGRSGNVGLPFLIKEPSWSHNTTLFIQEFKNVDPYFIYYFLKTIDLKQFAGGSAVPTLNRNHIHPIEIIIPEDIKEQKKIARILLQIDEKIELNKQINHNLEELAQTILNENFFIFSHYSENELCDTDIGKIPKDWKIFKLKDLFNHIKPGTNFQPKRTEEGIPFLNVRNINSGFIDLSDVKYISIEDYKQVHKTWAPEENDILISRIGTLGLTTIISKEDLPLAVHYNFINVKSEKLPYQFVYFLFKSNNFQRKYHTIKKYSVQEYVTIDDFSDIEIALPKNINDINSELKIFNSIFNKIQRNITEVKKLNNLRDYLLPKLMSGEIDVSEINCDL